MRLGVVQVVGGCWQLGKSGVQASDQLGNGSVNHLLRVFLSAWWHVFSARPLRVVGVASGGRLLCHVIAAAHARVIAELELVACDLAATSFALDYAAVRGLKRGGVSESGGKGDEENDSGEEGQGSLHGMGPRHVDDELLVN